MATERMNVRRMQTPEKPENEDLFFDPKRDITSKRWRDAELDLDGLRESSNSVMPNALLERLVALMLVNPEEKWLENNDGERIDQLIKRREVPANSNLCDYVALLGELKYAPPPINAKYAQAFDVDFVPKDAYELEKYRIISVDTVVFIYYVSRLHAINPSPDNIRYIEERRAEISSELEKLRAPGKMRDFLWLQASLKLIEPQKVHLTPLEWSEAKKCLAKIKSSDFADTAFNMAILAADDFKITDQGLQFIHKGNFKEGSAPMPATSEI